MPRPVLTQYLLKLATDQDEIVRFRAGKAARQAMKDAGLTPEQSEAVLSGDSDRLQRAVNDELRECQTVVERDIAITDITHVIAVRLPPPE
jgi:hypothetical protein